MLYLNIIIAILILFFFIKWLKSNKSIYYWGFISIITISTAISIILGLDGSLITLFKDFDSAFVKFISLLYLLIIITDIMILVKSIKNRNNEKYNVFALRYVVLSITIILLSTFFRSGMFFEDDIEYLLTEEGGSWGSYFLEILFRYWQFLIIIISVAVIYKIFNKKKTK